MRMTEPESTTLLPRIRLWLTRCIAPKGWVVARSHKVSDEAALGLIRDVLPNGWVVVPSSPTREMVNASLRIMAPEYRPSPDFVNNRTKHVWRYQAMIKARPK